MEAITINGEDWVKADSVDVSPSEIQIVKMPYANDVVGRVVEHDGFIEIFDANVIRRWGTTNGLGEIAVNGPTQKTILDSCPRVKVEKTAIIYTVDCVEDKWNAVISK